MSYVKVLFPESRDVYIDDEWQGSNRAASGRPRAFYVNAAQHTFRLGGAAVVMSEPGGCDTAIRRLSRSRRRFSWAVMSVTNGRSCP